MKSLTANANALILAVNLLLSLLKIYCQLENLIDLNEVNKRLQPYSNETEQPLYEVG